MLDEMREALGADRVSEAMADAMVKWGIELPGERELADGELIAGVLLDASRSWANGMEMADADELWAEACDYVTDERLERMGPGLIPALSEAAASLTAEAHPGKDDWVEKLSLSRELLSTLVGCLSPDDDAMRGRQVRVCLRRGGLGDPQRVGRGSLLATRMTLGDLCSLCFALGETGARGTVTVDRGLAVSPDDPIGTAVPVSDASIDLKDVLGVSSPDATPMAQRVRHDDADAIDRLVGSRDWESLSSSVRVGRHEPSRTPGSDGLDVMARASESVGRGGPWQREALSVTDSGPHLGRLGRDLL